MQAEYTRLPISAIVWVFYLSAVCGCISALALKGIFQLSVSSISAITSRMGILTVNPVSNYSGTSSFTETELFAVIFCFGLGSFVSGLILTAPSVDGSFSLIKLDFPSPISWLWRHQLVITICICCLAVSHAIVQSESDKIPSYLSGALPKSGALVFSVLLLSFSSSALSTFLTLHETLLLRTANHTSTLFDIFSILGFALRARDFRYMWKAHLLFWTFAGYVAGACIGANAYQTTLKFATIIVPMAMLAPLWIAGLALIVVRQLRLRPGVTLITRDVYPARCDTIQSFSSVIQTELPRKATIVANSDAAVVRRLSAWASYVSFVAGAINTITIQGIFQRSSTHTTTMITRMAMSFQYPPSSNARGGASNTAGAFVLAILSFNMAAFIAGFVLTTRENHSQGGRLHPLRMNYPTRAHWRWRHQLLLSVCISCLIVSHFIVTSQSHSNKNFISAIDVNTTSSVFWAWLLVTFSAGLLNALLSTGSMITLKAGTISGLVLDMFLGAALALRSRSTSRLWRVQLQFTTFAAFYLGGVAGSLVFTSSLGASSLLFPVAVLALMWLFGAILLFLRYRKADDASCEDTLFTDDDVARGSSAQLDARSSIIVFALPCEPANHLSGDPRGTIPLAENKTTNEDEGANASLSI